MRNKTRLAALLSTGIVLASSLACTQAAPGGQVAEQDSVPTAKGLVVREYSSLDEVAAYSTDIVVGTVTSGPEVVSASTVPTSKVKSSLMTLVIGSTYGKGALRRGDTITVRQFGTGTDTQYKQNFDSILKKGSKYALYLEPFYFEPGPSTGQFVIVGDVSAELSLDQKTAAINKRLASSFPSSISLNEIVKSASSLGSKASPLGLK